MGQRKRPTQIEEGPDAAARFKDAMGRLLQVSKDELARREAAHREARKDKPRRGPKPVRK